MADYPRKFEERYTVKHGDLKDTEVVTKYWTEDGEFYSRTWINGGAYPLLRISRTQYQEFYDNRIE